MNHISFLFFFYKFLLFDKYTFLYDSVQLKMFNGASAPSAGRYLKTFLSFFFYIDFKTDVLCKLKYYIFSVNAVITSSFIVKIVTIIHACAAFVFLDNMFYFCHVICECLWSNTQRFG